MAVRLQLLLFILFGLSIFHGCAEGPFWKAGKYTPWARNQWAEEEKIANTLFSKKKAMSEQTAAAVGGPIDAQQRAAESLAEVVHTNKVLLLRLHAVAQLGRLNCPKAIETLKSASSDPNTDVRLASIKAWRNLPSDEAIPHLQQILGSDTDIDVRLAATRALADFSGQRAVEAVSLALNDSDPALQLRAAESLQKITGEQFGGDIQAWQQYVSSLTSNGAPQTANNLSRPFQ